MQSIPYNPVFFSYALVTADSATLYIDKTKLSPEAEQHLGDAVKVQPYEAIFDDAKAVAQTLDAASASSNSESSKAIKRRIMISTKASWALSLALGGEDKVDELRSLIGDAKAIKNDTELEGMRACHVRDGAALSKYFAWLEEELTVKHSTLDEVQAADKLEHIRSWVYSSCALLQSLHQCILGTTARHAPRVQIDMILDCNELV